MTEAELKEFDSCRSPHIKYWVPIQWAFNLLRKAKDQKMIESDIIYCDMLEKIRQYRVNVLTLTIYDWIPVPLVYTQVVNIAVRAYFMVALLGRQYLLHDNGTPNSKSIDLYVPIMTILQFLFYIGWVKDVAEVLLNPLGDDDDDLETNWILDRNLQVGYSIVDDGYGRLPKDGIEKDIFFDDLIPQPLYTAEAAQRTHNPMIGSCNDLMTVAEDALLLKPRPRLMSTTTILGQQTRKNDLDVDESGRAVIPVRNYNAVMRRCNRRVVDHYSDSGNSSDHRNIRLLESLRRRFSKKRSRRGSTPSIMSDWYAQGPMSRSQQRNGVANGNGPPNHGNISRNSSVCSSILFDGVQSPFAQSLASNFGQSARASGGHDPAPLDINALDRSSDSRQDEEATSPTENKLGQSWKVNEMLPVIEEEREKGRMSYTSSDSVSTASLSDTPSKKDDPQDIKSILNKSLSTISESFEKEKSEVDLPPFAKTVSFGPTLFRQRTEESAESPAELSPSRSAIFHLADSVDEPESPSEAKSGEEKTKK
ncbi:Bestrophin-like protein [Aphelenchoides fujianensis]|nr:Bestrophin-like protein [Aphelenchoides fujianensis]